MDPTAPTDLTCRELTELVTDYLEDALPAAERTRFEAHLAECEGCRRYLAQMRATVDITGALPRLQGTPPMDALLEAFRGYRRR
jgi:anti-sigma factor RsiW